MIPVYRFLVPLAFALVVSSFSSPSLAQGSGDHVSAARAKVLRECSLLEQKYTEHSWGNTGYFQYLACMSAHGEPQ